MEIIQDKFQGHVQLVDLFWESHFHIDHRHRLHLKLSVSRMSENYVNFLKASGLLTVDSRLRNGRSP